MNKKIRNIAIIAHVDHGKTSLVDTLLKQSAEYNQSKNDDESMDYNDLERERGITILSKCTSIMWKGTLINILDTPGHADFGSEVERILKMVDGFVLVVDASEGVMPQTEFVLKKAAEYNLKPILLVNKIDRDTANPEKVYDETLNEMINLNENYLDTKVFYGSGRAGYCSENLEEAKNQKDMYSLLDAIVDEIPEPTSLGNDFQFLVSLMLMDQYFGRLVVGKIYSGNIKVNDTISVLDQNGNKVESFRINKLFSFKGIKKVIIEEAGIGEIVAIAGSKIATVNHNLLTNESLPIIKGPVIDPATVSVTFMANNSPFAGQEGNKLTPSMIGKRLKDEAEINVGIKLETQGERYTVFGRGELQISVIAEMMRREGFEFLISRPKIVIKEENGKKYEPIEEITVDVDMQFANIVSEQLNLRGAQAKTYDVENDRVKMKFLIPTRGILGYYSKFLSDTRGTGLLNKKFHSYEIMNESVVSRLNGVLVSNSEGIATGYALDKLQDRGNFIIASGTKVYPGMIIGVYNKDGNLIVNPTISKKLTNVRAAGKDEGILLPPPIEMNLQKAIEFIEDDELVEITPQSIRIKKAVFKG